MLKLVIFDFDNTLLNLEVDEYAVRQDLLAYACKKKIPVPDDMHVLSISSLLSSDAKSKKEVDRIWRKNELRSLQEIGIVRFPKAEALARRLKAAGFKLAIVSNSCHSTIDLALKAVGMSEIFDMVVGREDVEKPKPNQEMIIKVLSKLKVDAPDAVFLADSDFNAQVGAAAGVKTVILDQASPEF